MPSDAKDAREEFKGGVVSLILGKLGMIGVQGHCFMPRWLLLKIAGSIKL